MPIDDKKAKEIIQTMSQDMSLRKALKEHNTSPGAFFNIIHSNAELEKLYCDTQAAIGEQIAEEIIEIADNDHDPQRAKNRIDARKWYASKVKPKKFGDRIDIEVSQIVDIRSAIDEARKRTLPVRDQQNITDAEVIEVKEIVASNATGYESVVSSNKTTDNQGCQEKITPTRK